MKRLEKSWDSEKKHFFRPEMSRNVYMYHLIMINILGLIICLQDGTVYTSKHSLLMPLASFQLLTGFSFTDPGFKGNSGVKQPGAP